MVSKLSFQPEGMSPSSPTSSLEFSTVAVVQLSFVADMYVSYPLPTTLKRRRALVAAAAVLALASCGSPHLAGPRGALPAVPPTLR